VQTQVSDVQANLRLAMGRMTKDLILAGFLVNPSDFGAAVELSGGPPADTLTIRSRIVGDGFARVISNTPSGSPTLTVSDTDMQTAFPKGTSVRLFDPLGSSELDGLVYTVDAVNYNTATLTASLTLAPTSVPAVSPETVIIKIRDGGQPALQTIRYLVEGGALTREVNGSKQILARNVNSVTFTSDPATDVSLTNPVRLVDINLVGQSVGLAGGGAESSTKDRQLQASVALRNVN
jgi:hypothetical protein